MTTTTKKVKRPAGVPNALLGYETNTEALLTFTREGMKLSLPASHDECDLDGPALQMLDAFSGPGKAKKIGALIDRYSRQAIETTVVRFEKLGLLRRMRAGDKPWSERWAAWGTAAWAMHLATRNAPYAATMDDFLAASKPIAEAKPPPIYKCMCAKRRPSVALPPTKEITGDSLTSIFFARRTCRQFLDRPVSLDALATVLFHTAGAIYELGTDSFGTVLLKAAPSPGGRHGTELYFCARKVTGMPPGIYHYCVKHHRANLVAKLDAAFLKAALRNQHFYQRASVTFFFTYVIGRVSYKYKAARAYRLIHYEVGHYCQNLVLAGTALGLGVFQTGALADSVVEERLGIDGSREFLMYAAGIGVEDASAADNEIQVQKFPLPRGIRPKPHKNFERFVE